MEIISDIKSLFKALGGVKTVAALPGIRVGTNALYMAVNRGSIPYRWRVPLLAQAREKGLTIDPNLLGTETFK